MNIKCWWKPRGNWPRILLPNHGEGFLKQKQELEIAQYQGQKPDDAKVKKMQDLYNVLQLNPVAGEYIQAYIRFQMMFGDLSKTLSDTLKEVMD